MTQSSPFCGAHSNQVSLWNQVSSFSVKHTFNSKHHFIDGRHVGMHRQSCQCLCTDPHPAGSDRPGYRKGGCVWAVWVEVGLWDILGLNEKCYWQSGRLCHADMCVWRYTHPVVSLRDPVLSPRAESVTTRHCLWRKVLRSVEGGLVGQGQG